MTSRTVLPILKSAGCEVTVVETSAVGQATELGEKLDVDDYEWVPFFSPFPFLFGFGHAQNQPPPSFSSIPVSDHLLGWDVLRQCRWLCFWRWDSARDLQRVRSSTGRPKVSAPAGRSRPLRCVLAYFHHRLPCLI